MLVVVVTVNGMPVTVMEIVHVIVMLDGFVPAVGPVRVLRRGVLSDRFVLVVMVAVDGMTVRIVHVVDVIPVSDGLVPAVRPVFVLGDGVLGVGVRVSHDHRFLHHRAPALMTGLVPGHAQGRQRLHVKHERPRGDR